MRRRAKLKLAAHGLVALAFCAALAGGSTSALADGGRSASTAFAAQACESVIVKVHATHWVWVKETRKVHGHRVFVRRHGKIVRVHVRVSYLKAEPKQVCAPPTPAVLTPASPVAAVAVAPSAPTSPAPTEVVPAPPPPVNTARPTVSGTATSGQTLSASPGIWAGSPTGFGYQWQRCDSSGANCSAIPGASSQSHVLAGADVGSRLRVSVLATSAAGESAPASSAPTEVVTGPPLNVVLPSISGTAKAGQTLTAGPGTWSGSPTGFGYQWQRCDSSGANCSALPGSNSSTYLLGEADVGTTLRVAVTASNSAGPSTTPSAQTAVVSQASSTTFGKTTVGTYADRFGEEHTRVNGYTLPTRGSVSKLSIYLQPSGKVAGQQALRGVLYGSESPGAPGALLGVSNELVYHTTEPGGWYDLTFPTPLNLAAGRYWIGVISGATKEVAGYRDDYLKEGREINLDSYAAGPSNPFDLLGSHSTDNEQMSLYATYASEAPALPPVNSAPPTISGVAQTEQHLSASPGSWSESPSSYAYEWQRCIGASCSAIAGATSPTYTLESADIGHTVRVSVTASDGGGTSAKALSAATTVVSSSSGAHHLEYVFNDGLISVYDMEHGWEQVGTISLPQTMAGIRGVTVYPPSHTMYVSYGGDGGANGNGSVLAYDLVSDNVVWTAHLETGIDSGQVSADGTLLYMPTGEQSPTDTWNVLDTSDGALVETIQGAGLGTAPHNTVVSSDGSYVYLGARYDRYLDVYETATKKVIRSIGPLHADASGVTGGVRPFTVNGSNTLAFTTATEFDGFQVSSITTGNVLFTIEFAPFPGGNFPDSGPSHGISLSPDEKELYVVDDVNREIQVYDVSEVSKGVAPTPLKAIPVTGEGLEGTESPCAYDCGRGGWLQRSTDGKFVFVGDSGDVIATATREVVADLPELLNTKLSLEVDWEGDVPVKTSGRTGVGEVP